MINTILKYDILPSDRAFKERFSKSLNIKYLKTYYDTIDNIGKYNFFLKVLKKIISNLTKANILQLNDLTSFLLNKNESLLAILALQKLIKLNIKNELVFYNLGLCYYNLKKFHLARKYIFKVKDDFNLEQLLLDKAFLLSIFREKDLAKKYLYKLIKINPKIYRAIYDLSKISNSEDEKFIFKNFDTNNIDLKAKDLDCYYFALSFLYEKREDFENSLKFFKKGNSERYKKVNFNINKVENDINFFQKNEKLWKCKNDYLIDTQEMIEKYGSVHIFIVGMPRSGSTLIEQMLVSNPLFKSYGETNLFSKYFKFFFTKTNMKYIEEDDNEILNYGIFYNSHFSKSKKIKYFVNKMPFNYYSLGFIKKCLPNSIIIYSKRNYQEISFSLLKNYFSDLELNFCYSENDIIEYLKLFNKAIKNWSTILSKNSIYQIEYEKLVQDPSEIQKFFNFFNIPWDPSSLAFYKNNSYTDTSSLNQVDKDFYTTSINVDSFFKINLKDFFSKLEKIN